MGAFVLYGYKPDPANIKDVYQLRATHEHMHPNSVFFAEENLKFFGERMSEMYVWKQKVDVEDANGKPHTCYVLSKMSRTHPMGPRRTYAYFDAKTLEQIIK